MAYASGVHDAYHVLAPTLWPSISIMPRSNTSVDRGRSSPDPRPLPVAELASLYREFIELIQTPTSRAHDLTTWTNPDGTSRGWVSLPTDEFS